LSRWVLFGLVATRGAKYWLRNAVESRARGVIEEVFRFNEMKKAFVHVDEWFALSP
jgi:hypothetical protein